MFFGWFLTFNLLISVFIDCSIIVAASRKKHTFNWLLIFPSWLIVGKIYFNNLSQFLRECNSIRMFGQSHGWVVLNTNESKWVTKRMVTKWIRKNEWPQMWWHSSEAFVSHSIGDAQVCTTQLFNHLQTLFKLCCFVRVWIVRNTHNLLKPIYMKI